MPDIVGVVSDRSHVLGLQFLDDGEDELAVAAIGDGRFVGEMCFDTSVGQDSFENIEGSELAVPPDPRPLNLILLEGQLLAFKYGNEEGPCRISPLRVLIVH